jgi:molecular chaperone HtpG
MATHKFQAETNRLLKLIIHSLYSHDEIFLRELVSNASDAIDKLRYLGVSNDEYKGVSFDPRVSIDLNEKAGIMTISDNGIGMDEKDLEEHLGTIARSGTRRFLETLPAEAKADSNLIGQFGVGFYSCFMVASKVEVVTRKALSEAAWRWTSDGAESYDVEPAERGAHGTDVILHLNEEGKQYLSPWRIKDLVRKYSNHVAYPIFVSWEQKKYGEKGEETGEAERKEERANDSTALWKKAKSSISEQDYKDFYKGFADDDADPLFWLHTKAEGTIEYSTLLYVPSTQPFDLFQADYRPGVKLFVKRVFITDDDKELLPPWLRFVRGVIDSEDLPLNVSREILQQNRVMSTIRNATVKKLLGEFKSIASADPEKFKVFTDTFGRVVKEGLYSDFAHRDDLVELARFKSTAVEGWTSLADYKGRMRDGQKAVYYLSGGDEARLRKSPLLEAYAAKGYEVLLCAEEVDDVIMPMVGRYGDLEMKAINREGSESELGDGKAKAGDTTAEKAAARAKKILGDRVKDVRPSARLTESPACIIVDEHDPGLRLREMLKALGRNDEAGFKPILELNGAHPLVRKLAEADDAYAEDAAFVLLEQSLLVEGLSPEDPAAFAARINRLICPSA